MHKWRVTAEKMQDPKGLEDDRGIYQLTTRGRSARPEGMSRDERPNPRGDKMHTITELDAHCRKANCDCGHVICYRGWIDTDQTSPCQFCRPQTHERWLMACQARQKGYPVEAVHRILAGRKT